MVTNNTRQPVPRGLYAPAVTNIPTQWSASWFRQFLTNHLQNADTRNAISGPGISVTGGILEPATISAISYIGLPYSILGNPTDSTAPDTDISATVAGQVLTFTGSAIEFGTLELANNTGLGPSFTVEGLNPGTVLQATQPDVAAFSAVTFPLAVAAGDVIVGIGADALGSLAIGTNGQILSVVDLDPVWVDASSVAITSVVGTTDEIDVSVADGVATVSIDPAYAPSVSVLKGATWASGSALTSGVQDVFVTCPVAGTIAGVTVLTSGGTGSCSIDVRKVPYASFPPTGANSIVASSPPAISGGIDYQDTTLSGWTTAITAGDVLGFHLTSTSTFTNISVQLQVTQ